MNVLSTFNGMGCIWIALERLGIDVDKRYSAEIDKYANIVNDKNYPDTIQLGDVTKVTASDMEQIDLLVGGSPCQGFSFAGKKMNFEDPRSKLFFEYVRLLKECQPKYFLLENVKMKKEWEQVITDSLGVEPIEINSRLKSGQNRKRLYWTNIPNVTQPEDQNIVWEDVREYGVNAENFYYTDKAMQWLAKHSQKKNKVLAVHNNKDKMQMLEASHHKKYSSQRFFGIIDMPSDKEIAYRMRNKYQVVGKKYNNQDIEIRYDDLNKSLFTIDKDNNRIPFTQPHKIPSSEFFMRYITPLECERLQNVPNGYTDCVSNTQRYKMLGNGWTVDIISHILKGIKK